MSLGLRSCTYFVTASILALGWFVWSFADEFEATHGLTLADLTAYRAALSDKVTASNGATSKPSQAVSFKQLWAATRRVSRPSCHGSGTYPANFSSGTGRQFSPPRGNLDHFASRRPLLRGRLPGDALPEQPWPERQGAIDATSRAWPHGSIYRHVSQDGPVRGWRRCPPGTVDRGSLSARARRENDPDEGQARGPRRCTRAMVRSGGDLAARAHTGRLRSGDICVASVAHTVEPNRSATQRRSNRVSPPVDPPLEFVEPGNQS